MDGSLPIRDEAVEELKKMMSEGSQFIVNSAHFDTRQNYIIQYDDVIQSLDCGALSLLAFLYNNPPPNTKFDYSKLDKTILSSLSFERIFSYKSPPETKWIFDDLLSLISEEHFKKDIKFSDEEISYLKEDIKTEFLEKESPIFQYSPILIFMNGLLTIIAEEACEKILFVLPNMGIEDGEHIEAEVSNLLIKNFFPKDNGIPIMVDYSQFNTFTEYIDNARKLTNLEDTIIVTSSVELYEKSKSANYLKNVSLVFPESAAMNITRERICMDYPANILNEYIAYKNGPFRYNDPNKI